MPIDFKRFRNLSFHTSFQKSSIDWPQQPHDLESLISSKKITDLDGWIIHGTKMTNNGPFFGMDHQKSSFSLISKTLYVGGC